MSYTNGENDVFRISIELFEYVTRTVLQVSCWSRDSFPPTVASFDSFFSDFDDLIFIVNRWRKALAVQVIECSIVFLIIVIIHFPVVFNRISTAGMKEFREKICDSMSRSNEKLRGENDMLHYVSKMFICCSLFDNERYA